MPKKKLTQELEQLGAFRGKYLNASIVKYIKNREELEKRILTISPASSISESIFLLKKERNYCEVCGKETPFKSYGEGYRRFCSSNCRKESSLKKTRETNLRRYGVTSPAQSKEIREKMAKTLKENHGVSNAFLLTDKEVDRNYEKQRETMLERYGVEHPLQSEEILKRAQQTNLERYGNICPLHNEDIQQEIKENNLKKYGVEFSPQRKEVKEKIASSKRKSMYKRLITSDRLKQRVTPLFEENEYIDRTEYYGFKCNQCGEVFKDNLKNGKVPRCPVCYPKDMFARNPREDEVAGYLANLVPGLEIVKNDREILGGKELDLYLPQHKLAIEYNELWWHSEGLGRGRNYHLDKSKGCEEQGIRLIHIFEDEWIDKRDIVESILASSLGVFQERIGARKLQLSDKKEGVSQFLENNHLQGNTPSSHEVSLRDLEGSIYAVMTFKKPRYSKEADYELIRYAVKKDTQVAGGFQRLLKHFRKEHPGSILTYSDRRLFAGEVYRKNGFKELKPTPPDYWYSKNYIERESRLKYQKHKIEDADSNLTEYENMQLKGYGRIWGCGNWKFLLE